MGILAQCPVCKTRQSIKNKACRKCGDDLDKAKSGKRLMYWISYRLPSGKQKQEPVGASIDDARAADGKKKILKKEGKLFDIRDDTKMTFNELTSWYLGLEKVKALASYHTIKISIEKFNAVFGGMIVAKITPADLENYQAKRAKAGKAPATIDHEIGKTKTMILKAFDNGKISGETLRTFKKIKKTLKKGADVRDRILTHDEFSRLCENSTQHICGMLTMGYYTGMRRGEILKLTWDKVDMKNRTINLEAADTKDRERRTIPIYDELFKMLKNVTRHINDKHVFLFRGKPVSDIRTGLVKACKKAGITYGRFEKGGFIFHDLRHTFNTNMRKAGVPESVIMAITGHSTREMFDRYDTVDLDDTRQALQALEVFFRNVTQNVTLNEKQAT
ncbi:site-specific recombinase, phage integrase family [delta proteobacterium NaphS2]|nr:site-specific recombinase, phage integrase family [delta proteobacterium NaphS2]